MGLGASGGPERLWLFRLSRLFEGWSRTLVGLPGARGQALACISWFAPPVGPPCLPGPWPTPNFPRTGHTSSLPLICEWRYYYQFLPPGVVERFGELKTDSKCSHYLLSASGEPVFLPGCRLNLRPCMSHLRLCVSNSTQTS